MFVSGEECENSTMCMGFVSFRMYVGRVLNVVGGTMNAFELLRWLVKSIVDVPPSSVFASIVSRLGSLLD